MARGLSKNGYTAQNKVALVSGGKPYFDLLFRLIEQAKETIHLQVYIFSEDQTGNLVAAALKAAAQRGVKVYLLADGFASQGISKKFIDDFEEAHVDFRFFEPFFKSKNFYFGRRMHQKVLMVDSQYAIVGGINIADRYNDFSQEPAWLDFALFVQGEVLRPICLLCWKTWNGFPLKSAPAPCYKKQVVPGWKMGGDCLIRMRQNDWVRSKNEISSTYAQMIRQSHTRITILCSYFLPGLFLRRLMSNASKRGVKITVVTAGPSDVPVAKYAERWMYDWLLRNNITLYEYQLTILHAKIAVCDGEWLTVGSYNVNNISAYASIELNLDVRQSDFAAEVEQQINAIIAADCLAITPEWHRKTKNIFIQFIRWLAYQSIRLAFYLITFYYKPRH